MTTRSLVRRFAAPAFLLLSLDAFGASPEVSGTVSGVVGVAGARVSLVPVQASHAWGAMVLSGRAYPEPAAQTGTDASGRYRLAAPSPGLWVVVVEAPGRVPVQSADLALLEPTELPPVVPPKDAGAPLDVKGPAGVWVYASTDTPEVWRALGSTGWTVRPRFGAADAAGRLVLPRAEGERLRVTVLAPGGARVEKGGLEGGRIELETAGSPARTLEVRGADGRPAIGVQVRFEGFPVPIGVTNGEGRVRLSLPPTPVRIRLLAADGRRRTSLVSLDSPAVLSLPSLAVLPGRVLDAASRKPLAGALVWAAADPGAFSITDATGRYTVVPVEGDRLRLQAEAAGHLPLLHPLDWRPGGPLRAPTLALDPAASVAGQVVDAQGAPAPDALVQAVLRSGVRQRRFSRTGSAERGTAAGPDGRFRLDRLTAGETWEIRALRPGYAAARLTLPALRSRSDLRLVLEKGRDAFGRVVETVDRKERPVAGAEVRLLASTGELSLVSDRRPRGEEGIDSWKAATDVTGRFAVPSLPPGPVDLLVRKPGFAPVLVRAVPVPRGEGPFDLGTVLLEPSVEIRGRVTDRDGKPVAEAEIHATRDLRRLRLGQEPGAADRKPEAVTDAEGRFAVPDLRRGEQVDLRVRAKGFLPAEVEGVSAPAPKPVAVVLDRAARVAGRVVDPDGRPVPGAELNLASERPGEERGLLRFAARTPATTAADEDGRFAFESVLPGRAELRATSPGFQPARLESLEVPPKGLDGVKVVLERGAVIEGRVTTTAGDPVGDTRVTCGEAASISDADGVYRLEGVPPGPRTVQARHQDFPPLDRALDVQPVINPLDLIFEAGSEVAGRAVDEEGKGVEGVSVTLFLPDSPREREALSDAGGAFSFAHVSDGRYSIRGSKEGWAETERPGAVRVAYAAGTAVRDVEVRMTRGGKIAGRLLGLDLYDLAEVTVRAQREDGFEKPGRVDYSGAYEIAGLPPGDWLVRAALRNGAREAQARAALEPGGEAAGVDLEFGGVTLSGRVRLGGEPLRGAQVTLAGQDVAVRRLVESDWQGGFRLEDVEPGRYRIQINAPREAVSHSEDLALDSDREMEIDLAAARFSGTVVEEPGGEGIEGAVVALRRLEGQEAASLLAMGTDEDGYFVLPNVTEGTYRVTVTKDGYAPWEKTFPIVASSPMEDQRIPLRRTRGLELAPSLASGRRPPHVVGALLDGSGRMALFEIRAVDTAGVARFPTAPPGEWTMLVSAPGAALTEVPIKVPGDRVPVVLPAAGGLTVRVPQLAGSDTIAVLTLAGAGGPFRNLSSYGTVQTEWQVVGGKARVEGVPAGAWTVRVAAPDGRTWSAAVVTAAADQQVDVN